MKSNVEARQRAKAEKEMEKARQAEEERLDNEKRENNFEEWIEERRQARETLLQKLKEKERLKADLGNRKSLASQMRMKTLANLASDTPSKKRRRGPDDDTFRCQRRRLARLPHRRHRPRRSRAPPPTTTTTTKSTSPPNCAPSSSSSFEHDPLFTGEPHVGRPSQTGPKSLVHSDLNVERIRVPEVVFQPSAIAGLDQAGLVEIAADIVNQRFSGREERERLLRDVFVAGGNSLFRGFEERFEREFRGMLPGEIVGVLKVRRAGDAVLDAWKGAAEWAGGSEFKSAAVSRHEWSEKGGEYIKEHNLGNAGFA
ncbi:hypothetical protein PABG_11791 [Paracoccidioides brasiliensis Pb03]|nr:hypothetical protein PABG_11791 [Paracoccidioides brasiliensis Pb03]